MAKPKVHKIMNRPHHFHVFTACRKVMDTWEALAVEKWDRVTCKVCLKRRK